MLTWSIFWTRMLLEQRVVNKSQCSGVILLYSIFMEFHLCVSTYETVCEIGHVKWPQQNANTPKYWCMNHFKLSGCLMGVICNIFLRRNRVMLVCRSNHAP